MVVSGTELPLTPAGQSLAFDLPAGTAGFVVVVSGNVGATDFIGVQQLTAPDGRDVIRDFKSVAKPARQLMGQNGTGQGVVAVPLLEDGAVMASIAPGRWTIRLGGQTANAQNPKGASTPLTTPLRATLHLQRAAMGTVLDLDVWVPDGLLVNGAAVNAGTALSTAGLNERLDSGFALLRRLTGIRRGAVRAHPLPSRFRQLTAEADIDAVVRLPEANAVISAQLVLTNELKPDGQGEISGLSPCLPGAPGTPGTSCSAFIASLRANGVAWQDASVWVHELSHFVGLRHSSEFGAPAFDGLSDTPDCMDTSKTGLATCPDRNNLMFPSVNNADGLDALTLSETQAAAWRASPLHHLP